jgi:hypothetical protein
MRACMTGRGRSPKVNAGQPKKGERQLALKARLTDL